MPPPSIKLRLLFLLPVLPSLLAVTILAMLLVDYPILFVNHPYLQIYYRGGVMSLAHVTPNDAIGPGDETIDDGGPGGPRYKNFVQMQAWQQQLSRISFSHFGLHFESRPRVMPGATNFTASRTRTFGLNAEYLLALTMAMLFTSIVLYRRARRRYARQTAGYCRACGYDLRASPDRCPECGAQPASNA